MSAVSIADVKTHLNMSSIANDGELQRFIDAAETAIGHRVGPLTPVEVTETLDGGRDCLILRNPRAVSLTSVTSADGTTTTLTDFDLDTSTGIVYWRYGTAGSFTYGRRNVTVTYLAGWDPLPADLAHAVKELVRHLWETQRGASTGARPGFADDDTATVAGAFSSWPVRVQELLEPYTVPSVA